jgi:hypothetical protein
MGVVATVPDPPTKVVSIHEIVKHRSRTLALVAVFLIVNARIAWGEEP